MTDPTANPGRYYIGEPQEPWRSNEVEERAAQQILYTVTRSAQSFCQLRINFDLFFDDYTNKPVKLRDTTRIRSNVPSGLASEIVDTFHADIMCKIFRTRPIVVVDRSTTDPDEARVSENLLQYDLDMMPFFKKVDPVILSAEIYGVGAAKLIWEERMVNVPIRGTSERPGKPKFAPVRAYRGPVLEPKFIYDVYPDPNKAEIDDRYPVADVSWADYSDLKANPVYHNIDSIPELSDMKAYDAGIYEDLLVVFGDRIYQSEQRARLGMTTDTRTHPDGIFVIEWEGFFRPDIDWTDNGGRKHKGSEPIRSILTMANGVIIRAEPSPFRSGENAWVWGTIASIPGQLYGVGLIQKSKPQVHIVNISTNMALQNLAQTVNAMKVVRPDLLRSTMSLDDQPGGTIEVKKGNDVNAVIKRLDTTPLGNDVWRMINHGTERARGVSGAAAVKSGEVMTGSQTATESNLAFTSASQKFSYAMHCIDQSIVLPMSRKSHQLNQQFLDEAFALMVLGPDGKNFKLDVDPVMLAANPHFIPMSSTKTDNVQMRIAQIQSAIRIMTAMPYPWVEPLLKLFSLELVDEWRLPNLPQIKQLMEQAVQQAPPVLPPGAETPGAPTSIPGQSGGAPPQGRQPAPVGTGRQDRRTNLPTNMQELAKSMGGLQANIAGGK